MSVFVADDKLLELIELDAQAERIATGFNFTEGPLWHSKARRLYFVDIEFADHTAGTMYRWSPEQSKLEAILKPSQNSNGNTFDLKGRIITCVGGGQKVVATDASGKTELLASEFKGMPLNAPNDVICAPNGDIIFTDPAPRNQPAGQPQRLSAVYRLSATDGSLLLLADDFILPNGLVMSDDGSQLLINDTARNHVRIFDVDSKGALQNSRIFCELNPANYPVEVRQFLLAQPYAWGEQMFPLDARGPDGMKLDALGNLYIAANRSEGVWVFSQDGSLLGFIGVGKEVSAFEKSGFGGPANLAWGDDDWKTLYITAVGSVYRIKMKISGQPLPYNQISI